MLLEPKIKNSPLHALTFSELIGRIAQIYGRNFVPFIGLALVVQVPLTVINALINTNQQDVLAKSGISLNSTKVSIDQVQALLGPIFADLLIVLVVLVIGAIVQAFIVSAPIVFITSENQLERSATLGQAFQAVGKRFNALLSGVGLFYILIVGLAFILGIAFFLCGLGFGILVYVGLTVGALLVPVLMLENSGGVTALKRVWRLGKATIWPILGITLATYAANFAISLIYGTLVTTFATLVTKSAPANMEWLITGLSAIFAVLFAPILPIAYTLLYFNVRIRQESLIVALQTIPDTSLADVPIPAAPVRMFENDDLVNLAILTLGTFVAVLLLVGAVSMVSR